MDYTPRELAMNDLAAYLLAEHIGFRIIHDSIQILDWSWPSMTYTMYAALDDKLCELNEKYGTDLDID